MLNSKKNLTKSLHFNNELSMLSMTKNLKKFGLTKLHTQQNYNPKKFEPKRIKVLYRPLHQEHKFDSTSMGINEIVKKQNLPLITNDTIRNLILKFRSEREKEINEKKFFYKERSYEDIQKEKNTQFLMLRAMLRRDPLTIQSLMRRHRNEEIKIKRSSSMKSILNKKMKYKKKYIHRTALSEDNIIPEKFQMSNNESLDNSKMLILNNKKFKNDVWKKEVLLKTLNIRKAHLKKYEIKIRSVNGQMLGGRLSPFKFTINSANKKFNQDCLIINQSIISNKLDEISLFGIFDGNGQYGKGIAQGFKNYVLDYFKNGNDMKVTLKKDNFYSIMYNSFVYAQNYLINNSNKLNINMNFSGSTGILVLYPHNNSNKVYCANIGRNKCMFYSMSGPIKLSYELYPNRASEKDRIARFKESLINESKNKIDEINSNEESNTNKENNNNNNSDNNNNETKNKVNIVIDKRKKDAFLKEFSELDISRCIGNLAAEEMGIIPGPEIGESDVRINKGKFIVIGTESLWKYISETEVGDIVNTHYFTYNSDAACQDLIALAKDRWKEKNDGAYDDISVIVLFFDAKNL